jgi:hypothetical protein
MDTPTGAPQVQGQSTSKGPERTDTNKKESVASRPSSPYLQRTSSASPATSDQQRRASKTTEQKDLYQEFGQPSIPGDIPGAFRGYDAANATTGYWRICGQ